MPTASERIREARQHGRRNIAAVTITVEPVPGSPMAAAIHQGWGEQFIRAYLEAKMPAGSPVSIEAVILVA